MPRDVSASSSVKNVSGSSTTPFPASHTAPWMIPDGIWCSTNSPAPVSTVWPALAPPWYRTTRSARSARTSTIFPLPSSPHWAPTTTTQCVFGPNIDPQQKRPEEAGRWSILWGKLGRLKRACNSHTHLARALQRQPLRGIVGRVDDSRGGPVASHDRPRPDEAVFLGVREDDADAGVRRQRIDGGEDRDDAGAVIHGAGRIVGHGVNGEERRPDEPREAEERVRRPEVEHAQEPPE